MRIYLFDWVKFSIELVNKLDCPSKCFIKGHGKLSEELLKVLHSRLLSNGFSGWEFNWWCSSAFFFHPPSNKPCIKLRSSTAGAEAIALPTLRFASTFSFHASAFCLRLRVRHTLLGSQPNEPAIPLHRFFGKDFLQCAHPRPAARITTTSFRSAHLLPDCAIIAANLRGEHRLIRLAHRLLSLLTHRNKMSSQRLLQSIRGKLLRACVILEWCRLLCTQLARYSLRECEDDTANSYMQAKWRRRPFPTSALKDLYRRTCFKIY